jgi:hypothetical protein
MSFYWLKDAYLPRWRSRRPCKVIFATNSYLPTRNRHIIYRLPLIFQEIGITENMWGPCLQHTLLLAYKLEEFVLFLQQSRYNLGLFFNWLYLVLLFLLEAFTLAQ